MPADQASEATQKLRKECVAMMEPDEAEDEDADAEDLCNCKFTLAYGESPCTLPLCYVPSYAESMRTALSVG